MLDNTPYVKGVLMCLSNVVECIHHDLITWMAAYRIQKVSLRLIFFYLTKQNIYLQRNYFESNSRVYFRVSFLYLSSNSMSFFVETDFVNNFADNYRRLKQFLT